MIDTQYNDVRLSPFTTIDPLFFPSFDKNRAEQSIGFTYAFSLRRDYQLYATTAAPAYSNFTG